jgi:CDP-diacylglycerol--glycerol-3-phosphate 3-phosphatidyltransferase
VADTGSGRGRTAVFRPLRDELTDLPNVITLARIALIPVILILVDNTSQGRSALAAVVFVVAAVTDALDGYLARRLGLVTVVGKFLDPLADKLIVLATLVYLVAAGRAPAWLVVLLMSRELAITGLRAIASSRGLVIAAGAGGKTKTALQLVGITFLLVHFPYPILFFDYVLDFHVVGIYVLYVSLAMSILSAVQYFQFFAEAAVTAAEEMEAQGITREAIRARLARERASRQEARQLRKIKKQNRRKELAAARRERRRSRRARGRRRKKRD